MNNSKALPFVELKTTFNGRPELSAMTALTPKVPVKLWKKSSD